MTETLVAAELAWRHPEPGLWVASAADGKPVGIITERWVHGFVVTGRTGRNIGRYASLGEAQHALVAELAPL